jgi:hypothetical protein
MGAIHPRAHLWFSPVPGWQGIERNRLPVAIDRRTIGTGLQIQAACLMHLNREYVFGGGGGQPAEASAALSRYRFGRALVFESHVPERVRLPEHPASLR